MPASKNVIHNFDFEPGHIIAGKYKVIESLGSGWEGEVFKIQEIGTGILRAAKFFFPKRNKQNKVAIRYARMLHRMSSCPIIIHYTGQEFIQYRGQKVTCFMSEFVQGELLNDFINRQPGKRIGVFRALHLLHALVSGLEAMHQMNMYHGDLHAGNIIIKRYGLGFDLKLLDMYHWGGAKKTNMNADIIDSIKVFYDVLGGSKYYATYPDEIKQICCGLKKALILKKFKSASQLKNYLENIDWQSAYREP